jgi:hypothetical protein
MDQFGSALGGSGGGKTTTATATSAFTNTYGADPAQTLALIIGGIGAVLLLLGVVAIAIKKL